MNLEGRTTRLRALEPGDIDLMYAWENDTAVWSVSGTLAPCCSYELLTKAEAFAIRAGGRSPRVAKQFIEQCAAGVQK